MTKKLYNAPAIVQEEVVLEQGIAVSTEATEMTLIQPEEWEEGNTNWW